MESPFNIESKLITTIKELDIEQLRAFADLHEDPANEQSELYIYCCFKVYQRQMSYEYIKKAHERAEVWAALAEIEGHDGEYTRRMCILNTISMVKMDRDSIIAQCPNAALDPNPLLMINYGASLGTSFEEGHGDLGDLDKAILVTEFGLQSLSSSAVDRGPALINLGSWLGRRFDMTSRMEDIDRAVDLTEEALAIIPQTDRVYQGATTAQVAHLYRRFECNGNVDDLNRLKQVANAMAQAPTEIDPANLANMGTACSGIYELVGEVEYLNQAIQFLERSMHEEHKDRNYPTRLLNLASALNRRFYETGATEDIDRAVEVGERGVNLLRPRHRALPAAMNNLASSLNRRFRRTGQMEDLNRAIDIAEELLATHPASRSIYASWCSNLGIWLSDRFERTNRLTDMDRSVELSQMAVEVAPPDYPKTVDWLVNLATHLRRRFQHTVSGRAMEDINRAIGAAQRAVATANSNHTGLPSALHTLSVCFRTRYDFSHEIEDLDKAIEMAERAIAVSPQDHPNRTFRLLNLGVALLQREREENDLKRALVCFREGYDMPNGAAQYRIMCGCNASTVLISSLDWNQASLFLENSIKLLTSLSSRSIEHSDKQHMLARFNGVASRAAAVALNAGKDYHYSLELLELGRGIISGLLLEIRSDVSDLEVKHPLLAQEFITLRDELDAPARPAGSSGWRASRRRQAERRLNQVIRDIRRYPEFSTFLLQPSCRELKEAARFGPIIVVNVSQLRCDAFLVEKHRISLLPLPDLQLEDVQENNRKLRNNASSSRILYKILEWLRFSIAEPVLNALGYIEPPKNDNWPRVWWIPTGELSQLPLHAAGKHMKGCHENVLDRVISSYSSSIKALIYGRRYRSETSFMQESVNALLVAMDQTPGLAQDHNLPFANSEVAILEKLCPSLNLNPIRPQPRCREEILSQLSTSKIFHFAGHGLSSPSEPASSSLLLDDWNTTPLTVADIRDQRLQQNGPFLGYLSACSTGRNRTKQLIDEGIHLISACQLAGFRHVIGTLWEVSDMHCVHVATVLYKTLCEEGLTDIAVSRGLHRATKMLRDGHFRGVPIPREANMTTQPDEQVKGENIQAQADSPPIIEGRDVKLYKGKGREKSSEQPLYWVPYVHFGV
ncbi:hypothetical protein CNMCM8927_004254 [Aspergillus lentulus]|uniref:CHAT domain-containing protein n=1 Tax=Aspergillus lentulus TaxID=293939 RepID=A0AAN6BS52_ASPLE|nr:hypothetical protein CNMCM8927_004254 [Aspergillus lentulus]